MRLARKRQRRSFVGGLDAVAGVGLALVAFGVFAYSMQQFSFARRLADERRAARMAAECQLAWLRAVGVDESGCPAVAVPTSPIDVEIERSVTPGTELWSGFAHVRIVARRIGPGYDAAAELSSYVPIVRSPIGGQP